MKLELGDVLVFKGLNWSPSINFQSIGRIRRPMPKPAKPKIIRKGRYYIRADMADRYVPLSYRFKTRRAALKYFAKPFRIVSSNKQFEASYGTRPWAAEVNQLFIPMNAHEGPVSINIVKERPFKADFKMKIDYSKMRIE